MPLFEKEDLHPLDDKVLQLRTVWNNYPEMKKLVEAGYLDQYTHEMIENNIKRYLRNKRRRERWKAFTLPFRVKFNLKRKWERFNYYDINGDRTNETTIQRWKRTPKKKLLIRFLKEIEFYFACFQCPYYHYQAVRMNLDS